MNTDFVLEMFSGLDDKCYPIGGSFLAPDGNTAIPFLCESHPFIALYHPIVLNQSTYATARKMVMTDADHEVSENAYLMKFASATQWCSGREYAPIEALALVKHAIRHRIPQRLAKVTQAFMSETVLADELYFIPGADDAVRVERLNLWYGRIADRIATGQLGLHAIHLTSGDYWYGYRKA
ncbi:hypothetical protein ALO83_103290 [Pseudomonas cannabina pv. alisalensis]|uniref:Uncharacterized protein n=3 Tax=Pseudomonas syringae group TaxID=136849 RepID=A0A3M3R901_PSECA|nr:hypothetical protein [Pseudomonas cannabina]KPW17525.1 hypothetical protein ALO83_103290 [Pseudomonas cannabina pv. alisalensis]MBM0138705.1 hypothetical protein [Pseudomonas cannabina pv. alisalensis]RMN82341.1 hypothetical protein ALQ53_103083 [Pseudomonas cannabina]RMN84961.1 hypothetical protein ALQ52_103906 [Pseudomonas cannabina pv. alisalensis]RMN92954.1 hypothetical protein ALQ51_02527 [Pseudomonas cannabina]